MLLVNFLFKLIKGVKKMLLKKTRSRKGIAVLVMAVFLFSFMSFNPGDNLALAAYPTSDKGITPSLVEGNTGKCDFKIDEEGTGVNGTWDTGFGELTISGDGTYFDWEFESDPEGMYAVSSVWVKGGPNHHEYDYSGTGYDSDGNLASPEVGNGNVAEISHLCFNFEELVQPEPETGCLEVTKEVEGIPDSDNFDVPDFEITITGPSYPNGDTKTFSYPDDLTQEWCDLEPGDYEITEGDLPLGWTAGGVGTVTVVADETATATVTNTYDAPDPTKGALKVTKVVEGDTPESGTTFEITITGVSDGASFPDGDTQTLTYPNDLEYTWTDLEPGDYLITEGELGANWTTVVPENAITVVAGQVAEATVTNTYDEPEPDPEKGSLSVTKSVYGNANSVPDFEIWVTGPSPSIEGSSKIFNAENGWTQVWNNLEPGEYTISEVSPGPGWEVSYSSETVSVVAGETTYASVSNTYREDPPDRKGDLEITKVVRRGNRNMDFEFFVEIDGEPYEGSYWIGDEEFTTDDGTLELKHGETAVIKDLPVGTEYSVTEANYSRYSTSSVGDEGTIDEDGNSATFYNSRRTGGGSGGGGGGGDNDRDDEDGDEYEEIIVPQEPQPAAPPTVTDPEPVVVPSEPAVMAPVVPALPKTGGYPMATASFGTLLLGLGLYLRKK